MNKILRYSFIALLAFICQVSFAQTVFDFDNNYKTLFPNLTGVSSSSSHNGDFTEATTCEVDGFKVTISAKTSGNNDNRIWGSSPRLRMYSGTITVEAPAGKTMSKITIENGKWNTGNKVDNGTVTDKGVWTGEANKVVFTIAGNTQIKNISITVPGTVITYTDVASVKDLLANYTADTKNLNLTLTDAKVLYVNNYNGTVNTYVREGESAIELRTLGFDMPVGSVINGTVKVDLAYSYGVPYLKANDATDDENLSIAGSTVTAEPIVATIADLNANKYLNDLVVIKDAKLSVETTTSGTSTRTNYFVVDGDAKVQLYDKFKVSNLTELTDGNTYTVQGIFGAIYSEVPEILMTENVKTPTNINGIAADAATVNAPAYNLAGQKVSAAYKGVVIKAGKKFVQK